MLGVACKNRLAPDMEGQMPRDAGRQASDDAKSRFEAMFASNYAQVQAYARRRAPTQAADVTSEVFLTAWRRLDDVPADALPWLLGVARRVIANSRRADSRLQELPLEPATLASGAESDFIERAIVIDAFRQLGERDREMLMLVAWEGLSPARAARVLGCSVPAFAVRLHRARGRLARAMEAFDRPQQRSGAQPGERE